MHDWVLEHRDNYTYLGRNVETMANEIKKDKVYARYDYIKIAAEVLQRPIYVYRDSFSENIEPEKFENENGP